MFHIEKKFDFARLLSRWLILEMSWRLCKINSINAQAKMI